ncbi:unnamed protein product [Linum tenue]|uniref:RING-type E3 ubiquitin transferase n=1 Tax=Linum tenue TaxID=586396 RepID=A0AAV0IM62_9ROSI|nr:unnamed protein product [Linum tenue]
MASTDFFEYFDPRLIESLENCFGYAYKAYPVLEDENGLIRSDIQPEDDQPPSPVTPLPPPPPSASSVSLIVVFDVLNLVPAPLDHCLVNRRTWFSRLPLEKILPARSPSEEPDDENQKPPRTRQSSTQLERATEFVNRLVEESRLELPKDIVEGIARVIVESVPRDSRFIFRPELPVAVNVVISSPHPVLPCGERDSSSSPPVDVKFEADVEALSSSGLRVPASESAIESLETVAAAEAGEFRSEERGCAICLQDLAGSSGAVKRLPCCHVFHHDCLVKWLRFHHTCPLCRSALPMDLEFARRELLRRIC